MHVRLSVCLTGRITEKMAPIITYLVCTRSVIEPTRGSILL